MSFAYDIVLFCEASLQNVQTMLPTVDLFCALSGQRINFHKSQVICSDPIPTEVRDFLFRPKKKKLYVPLKMSHTWDFLSSKMKRQWHLCNKIWSKSRKKLTVGNQGIYPKLGEL